MSERICDVCKNTYRRRNLTEMWTVRNPGHRKGWLKTIQKVCIKCLSVAQAHRILDLAEAKFTTSKRKVHA